MFLEVIAANFLTQVTKKLMTEDAVMDLILTKKELTRDVKPERSSGCRDYEFRCGVQDPQVKFQGKAQDHKL